MPEYHEPVMLAETIEHLKVKKGGLYIDATLGDGGHTISILRAGGRVLGLDYDSDALNRATKRLEELGLSASFTGVNENFKNIEKVAVEKGFNQVNGVVYDLGYSSFQMDQSQKGLSFSSEAPLDMRLDKTLGVSAADLINFLSEDQLTKLIFDYSDEKLARKFAKAIVKHRSLKRIQTAKDLAEIIASEAPSGYEHGRIHPATRTFMALRMAVNDELNNLKESLPQAERLLLPGGRMVIISFHSKEDELAKHFGQNAQPTKSLNTVSTQKMLAIFKKPLVPTEGEVARNVRSRSAKMRVFEAV